MFDHGVYSLNLFRWLTGQEPTAFQAMTSTPDRDGRFTEVEENVQWLTRFPSGAIASGAGSYGTGSAATGAPTAPGDGCR